jgi:hypothetical protein
MTATALVKTSPLDIPRLDLIWVPKVKQKSSVFWHLSKICVTARGGRGNVRI